MSRPAIFAALRAAAVGRVATCAHGRTRVAPAFFWRRQASSAAAAVFRAVYTTPPGVAPAPEHGHPTGRCGHGSSRIGHHMFAFGGDVATPPTGVASDEFWSYSLATNSSRVWTRVKGNAGPSARFAHTSNGKEDALSITILGGTDAKLNRLDEHWRFEVYPQTLSKARPSILGVWHRLPSLPSPRDWHTSTLVQRADGRALIAVIGGRPRGPTTGASGTNQVFKYSVTREKWDVLAENTTNGGDEVPGPMAGHSAVFSADTNSILVLGRGTPSIVDERARAEPMEVWRFSLAAHVWERVVTRGLAPPVRSMAIVAVAGGGAFVFGGMTLEGGKPKFLNDMWRLDLATSTWASIPTIGAPEGLAAARLVDATVGQDHRLLIMGGETPDRKVSMNVWEISVPEGAPRTPAL